VRGIVFRLVGCGLVLSLLTVAPASEAAQAAAPAGDQCVEELRSGHSEWVECHGAFEADASAQGELAKQTFDMVKNARCGGTIRVQRAALMSALARNAVLELDPQ